MNAFGQRLHLHLVALVCALEVFGASLAFAQEPLAIDVDGADEARVAEAIRAEAARLEPTPSGRLTVRRRGRHATVVYTTGSRRIERSIKLQPDARGSAEEIALLAASLMRDDSALFQVSAPAGEPAATETAPAELAAAPALPEPRTAPTPPDEPPASVAFVSEPAALAPASHDPCSSGERFVPVGFDLIPYVGTSSAADVRNASRVFSLNLLGGLGNGLRGFALSSIVNVETGPVCGVQLGGLVNVALGDFSGFQLGGAVNATGAFNGAQLSGVLNVSKEVRGVQLAGAVNVARGDFDGVQLAGAVNVAANVDGVQLGTVNVSAGRVRGVQVGLVNVAETSELSIGLVSINTKGRTHIDVWSELEIGLLVSAVKHGGAHWHGFYGLGTRLTDPNLMGVLGLGGHVRFAEWIYLNLDTIAYVAPSLRTGEIQDTLTQARGVVGFNLVDAFAIYAGPSFNALFQRSSTKDWSPDFGFHSAAEQSVAVALWPGATLGVQVLSE